MTIQERKNDIYHDYGVIITEEMTAIKVRELVEELDQLADDLENQEAFVNTMKDEMIRAIKDVALKYKNSFHAIYLYGYDVTDIEFDDINYEE